MASSPMDAEFMPSPALFPWITLLTDFGLKDSYVGVMKGVIASVAPQARVIDICHEISPQDVQSASFQLGTAYSHFPPNTIHVVVIDPGVGGHRRAIALDFGVFKVVGPDNGVFSSLLQQSDPLKGVVLDNSTYWYQLNPSSTFHGRDIFAPAAAYLSQGLPMAQLGSVLELSTLNRLSTKPWENKESGGRGMIQSIDHFGNLITNIPASALVGARQSWSLEFHQTVVIGRSTYGEVALGQSLALVGSHGWLELAINGGNAQAYFNASLRDPVELKIV